jgi:flagellar hook-associated protein FlgK
MMRFQRAFQASARYVNVVDELLDLVVNRLGA